MSFQTKIYMVADELSRVLATRGLAVLLCPADDPKDPRSCA